MSHDPPPLFGVVEASRGEALLQSSSLDTTSCLCLSFSMPIIVHIGKAKIKARLIGDCDPDEWDLPPKPKSMRWSTYNRLVEKFDSYEEVLDRGIAELMAKLLGKKI
jgi:hypothetical protein